MKRNQKLMFDMLRHIESPISQEEQNLHKGEDLNFHSSLLWDAKLISGNREGLSENEFFWKKPENWELTNKGYDQLDLIRRKQREAPSGHSMRDQVDVPWSI